MGRLFLERDIELEGWYAINLPLPKSHTIDGCELWTSPSAPQRSECDPVHVHCVYRSARFTSLALLPNVIYAHRHFKYVSCSSAVSYNFSLKPLLYLSLTNPISNFLLVLRLFISKSPVSHFTTAQNSEESFLWCLPDAFPGFRFPWGLFEEVSLTERVEARFTSTLLDFYMLQNAVIFL